nr:hypothetical protein [Tanacetum cinerariifolium]
MHLEKVEHPRAKDVLKKIRQSSGLNGEQKRMTQTVEFFDDAYGALQWGDCKEAEEPRIPDTRRRKYIRYNKDEVTVCGLRTVVNPFQWEGVHGMPENPFGVALSMAVT